MELKVESKAGLPVEPVSGCGIAAGLGPPSRIVVVFLCGMLAFLVLYATQPLLPLFEQIFHASKGAVGLTVSASSLGVALSAPILGLFAERLNRKRVIVFSAVVLTAPTLLAATSPSLHVLVFWRFLQGILIPGIFAITIAYVTEEWSAGSVPLVMSIYVSGTAFGGCTGRVLAGVITEYFGWRAAFLALSLITFAGAFAIARWLPAESKSGEKSQPLAGLVKLDVKAMLRERFAPMLRHFRNPRLVSTYLIGFNLLFSLVGVFTYITFYLAAPPFRLSTEDLSYLFLVYLIGLVSTPAAGTILHRIGLRYGVVLANLLSLGGALITLVHSLPVIVLGLAACATGVFISQACATTYIHEAAPLGGGVSAVGLYIAFYYVGGTVGGVVPSYAWRWGGWTACAVFIAALDLVTIGIAIAGWQGGARSIQIPVSAP